MNKIYMIGDSIMQYNNIFSYPQVGWGQALHLFTKNDYIIEVHAKNGRSTKSFIDEGRFDVVLSRIGKGDFLICQFGHNDEKDDPLRHTDKDTTYLENLQYFYDEATKKGAHVVFATSVTRRSFENGVCIDSHKGYPQAMLKWANEHNYTCIDLNTITRDLYNKLGEEETVKFHMIFGPNIYRNYPEGKKDNSHLVMKGALMVCENFVREIEKTNDPIKDCFLELDKKEEIDQKMLID